MSGNNGVLGFILRVVFFGFIKLGLTKQDLEEIIKLSITRPDTQYAIESEAEWILESLTVSKGDNNEF